MRRHLDAAELADAGVSAACVLGLLTLGRLLAAGTFFQVIATVVIAVLAARRRPRAVVVATAAAVSMAVLLGGIGPIGQAFVAGLFGATGGVALRRRLHLVRHVALTVVVAWPVVALGTLAFLTVFSGARELSLENGRNQWLGVARVLESLSLTTLAEAGTSFVDWSIAHWWLTVPALQLAISVAYALIVRRLGRAVLDRVNGTLGTPWHPPPPAPGPLDPVPVDLVDPVIDRVDGPLRFDGLRARIAPGDRLVLSGPNGSGKSTLLEGLAGLHTSVGLSRPGAPGLGCRGGTALIGQSPDTQVVGPRVVDDLRWGLDHLDDDDVAAALASVGLGGREHQPTNQLSGGEQQRLAIAAALARRPRLLLSDESTAMLDPDGRSQVLELLTDLPGDAAVVHTTHHPGERTFFDQVIEMPARAAPAPAGRLVPVEEKAPGTVLSVQHVGFVHDAGSPWARRSLADVSFEVGGGDLVVVSGPNGSGKTTLVRLLAGLARPTEGAIRLHGITLDGPTDRLGVVFQHPGRQLLRATVAQEVASLTGSSDPTVVTDALAFAGLDAAVDGSSRVGELSGGQQRRLLLGSLASRNCDVVVLDEPLAGLDEPGRARLAAIVERFRARGTGVVVVSHEPGWAADPTTTIELVAPRDGTAP